MTVNGENKEPIPFPEAGVGAAGTEAQAQPPSPGDIILEQAKLVQDLGLRTAMLIDTIKDTFVRFLVASEDFYQMVRAIREVKTQSTKEPNDNSTTDSPTTQAS